MSREHQPESTAGKRTLSEPSRDPIAPQPGKRTLSQALGGEPTGQAMNSPPAAHSAGPASSEAASGSLLDAPRPTLASLFGGPGTRSWQGAPGLTAPRPAREDGATSSVDGNGPPVRQGVVPAQQTLKASAGEEIIFGAVFDHQWPGAYKLVFTSTGGHFDAQGSNTTMKTFPGIDHRNISWFVDAQWNGVSPVTMRMELQLNRAVVVSVSPELDRVLPATLVYETENWTFTPKGNHPTTITQREGAEEHVMPAVYTYQLGPSHTQQGPSYHNYTILEKFAGPFTTNLKVTDLKPEYANRHGLDSDAKIAPHFFPGMGHFGTFVVDAQDQFIDHHYGMQGVDEARAQLVAPKDIEKTLIQTYESQPGQPLGTYEITRLQKHGETALKVKKRRL